MSLKTKLDQIEQQAKEQVLHETVLAATSKQWENMTETERNQMREAAQQACTPIVIIDRQEHGTDWHTFT